jgi:hypothetical protein
MHVYDGSDYAARKGWPLERVSSDVAALAHSREIQRRLRKHRQVESNSLVVASSCLAPTFGGNGYCNEP